MTASAGGNCVMSRSRPGRAFEKSAKNSKKGLKLSEKVSAR